MTEKLLVMTPEKWDALDDGYLWLSSREKNLVRAAMTEVDLDELQIKWRTEPVVLGKGGLKFNGTFVDPYKLLLAHMEGK